MRPFSEWYLDYNVSTFPSPPGINSRNCPPSGSECHCITGTKQASCVALRYKSNVGSGPAKPPMSKPQNGMPVRAADNPARRALANSLFWDC